MRWWYIVFGSDKYIYIYIYRDDIYIYIDYIYRDIDIIMDISIFRQKSIKQNMVR